ncbi:hypothetical protein SL1157_2705 [Ruegeria lacuscaerulensis ITI-1157]|nr:hypothetical protein SL1157_2705 [Ruegeria lacuscaerulensis ITI-1157]
MAARSVRPIWLGCAAQATDGSRRMAAGDRSRIIRSVSGSVSCEDVGTGISPTAIAPR